MGEVYRARDTKLKREVAIKTLPDEFSLDPERLARFQREAEALAALSHPNIGSIYHLQESDGSRYLVLELIEGDTLADILARRGALPVDEALNIAKQICEALEAAHEKGVVHRDLKPANVKILPDGRVKVLDFGLAKAIDSNNTNPAISNSPTMMSVASMPGVILGTASYMSPEQAKGRPTDMRTDIFAFGCVLYEMLTGKRAFDGDDVADVLSSVLKTEPDWTRLPAELPFGVRNLLRLCLEKNVKNRRSSATDARLDIDLASKDTPGTVAIKASAIRTRGAWVGVGVLTVTLATVSAAYFKIRNTPESGEARLEINIPDTHGTTAFALSPDGRSIVFSASGDGPQRLWLRRLENVDAQPLAGTEGGAYPFWSPDNASVGFFANGKLQRLDLSGGPPRALADAQVPLGGTWGRDGTILFSAAGNSPLLRLSDSGTPLRSPTKLGLGQVSHRWPQFLPDGKSFLYYVNGNVNTRGIYLGFMDGTEPKRLTAADSAGAYLAPDHVLFVRQNALLAQRFDVSRQALTGDPVAIADPVESNSNWRGTFAVSASGIVAYRAGGASRFQLAWFDRVGKQIGVVSEPDADFLSAPEISPDGRRLAVDRTV
jgi:serine/threonine protein kinase